MKIYHFIRKSALVAGVGIVAISALIFLVGEISSMLTIAKYLPLDSSSRYAFFVSFTAPLQYLISGLGSGGILILLALGFKPEEVASFGKKQKTLAKEQPEDGRQ